MRAFVCACTCLIVFLLQVQDDGTTLQYNPYSWNMVSIGIVFFYVCNKVLFLFSALSLYSTGALS